ncbi:MAG TPA: FtsX-like permease family protein [Steroidobacteraceae bacterium]|nr:FtsX-like permease family protein [Steroidobacteraceae bacterium]
MMTFDLAVRNLKRNRRRSITTLAAIVVGTVAILLFGGYTRNIRYGLQMGFVRSSGHLQIQHQDYFLYGSGNPAAYGIADYLHVIEVVRHDPVLAPMLTVVTPTLTLGGIAGNFEAGLSRTVIATGVDVEGQNALRKWNDFGYPGTPEPLALTGTAANAAVVGAGVARVLQLCGAPGLQTCSPEHAAARSSAPALPSDLAALSAAEVSSTPPHKDARVELLAATARGAPNVASLSVIKAESQAVKDLDDIYVALHLAQAQRLIYGGDVPQVTAIIVQLRHTGQIPAARARLEQLLATTLKGEPLEVHDYETLNPYYGQTVGFFAAIFGFISILIGVIVLFTVGNTMSMAVVERTPEIGTLRAVGLRRSGIRKMFMAEGMLLGLLGSVLGIIASLILAYLINHGGITWTPPGRVDAVPLTVRVWGEPAPMIAVVIALTVVTILSSWIPSRRGARINIVSALRHA